MIGKRLLYAIGGIVLLAVIFQLFFRQQYIVTSRYTIRVDRITGASCFMPCLPTATPVPPTPTPSDEEFEQNAILLVEGDSTANAITTEKNGSRYRWTATVACHASVSCGPPSLPLWYSRVGLKPTPEQRQVWLVCWCDSGNYGWRWEVHLDKREVYYVDNNSALMSKYGIVENTTSPSPSPTPTPISAFDGVSIMRIIRESHLVQEPPDNLTRWLCSGRAYVVAPNPEGGGCVDLTEAQIGRASSGIRLLLLPVDSGGSCGYFYYLLYAADPRPRFVGMLSGDGNCSLYVYIQNGYIIEEWPDWSKSPYQWDRYKVVRRSLYYEGHIHTVDVRHVIEKS